MGKFYEKSLNSFVDGMLDRINVGGLRSLSDKERRFLDGMSGNPDKNLMNEIIVENFPLVTNGTYAFRLTGIPEVTGLGYYIPGVLTSPSPLDDSCVIEVVGGLIENPSEGTHIYDFSWSVDDQEDVVFDIGDMMEDHEGEFIDFTDLLVDQIGRYFWPC